MGVRCGTFGGGGRIAMNICILTKDTLAITDEHFAPPLSGGAANGRGNR